MIFLYQLQSLVDHSEISETQKVHFKQAQLFDCSHVELSCQPLVRHIQRYIFVQRHLADHDTCSVCRGMTRHALNSHRHIKDVFNQRFSLIASAQVAIYIQCLADSYSQFIRDSLGNRIRLCIAGVEHPPDISDCSLGFERSKGYNLRHLVLPIFAYNVIDDLLPAVDTEIDVDIRHADTLRI